MNPRVTAGPLIRPTVGVVIRFKDSARTLPAVLNALAAQTNPPDLILGVNSGSSDASPTLLRAAGAQLVDWTAPYHHSKVLNFALSHCPTDLVLVLSSHTVLETPDAVAQMVAALADPRTACVSCRWDDDLFYSAAVDWQELQAKGLKFGAIYSNSMGMLRRSLWEQSPFDETTITMEDGMWALDQIKQGRICRRLKLPFSYQRSGHARDYLFAVVTFQLAARHGLRVAWLGVNGSLRDWLTTALRRLRGEPVDLKAARARRQRLWAWCTWRFVHPTKE